VSRAEPTVSDVAELTSRLVRINTVNPPGNEEEAVHALAEYLDGYGLEVDIQPLAERRANLIARLRGEQEETGLVLSGHIDVVHPGESRWQVDPFAGEVRDGRIVGRGSADMKGGLAAMAVALTRLAGEGFRPTRDLVLAVSAGEEVDTAGARLLAKSRVLAGARYIVVGEPTGLDVFIAEKGVLWLRIVAHGRTAHGSMPHLGVNAVSFMAEVARRIDSIMNGIEPNEILSMPTVSVNTISGGVKTNVVPDRCEMEVDMRIVPGQTAEGIQATVESLLAEVREATGLAVETEVAVLQNMPPVQTPADDPLVATTVAAARAVGRHEPRIGGVSYGTDGAVLAPALGANLVIFGPGKPEQAHQPNEFVDLWELDAAAEAYAQIVRNMDVAVG